MANQINCRGHSGGGEEANQRSQGQQGLWGTGCWSLTTSGPVQMHQALWLVLWNSKLSGEAEARDSLLEIQEILLSFDWGCSRDNWVFIVYLMLSQAVTEYSIFLAKWKEGQWLCHYLYWSTHRLVWAPVTILQKKKMCGGHFHCQFGKIANYLEGKPLGGSLRAFPETFSWAMKTHLERGQDSWLPILSNKEKAIWILAPIALLLNCGYKVTSHHAYPNMRDYTFKLWEKWPFSS